MQLQERARRVDRRDARRGSRRCSSALGEFPEVRLHLRRDRRRATPTRSATRACLREARADKHERAAAATAQLDADVRAAAAQTVPGIILSASGGSGRLAEAAARSRIQGDDIDDAEAVRRRELKRELYDDPRHRRHRGDAWSTTLPEYRARSWTASARPTSGLGSGAGRRHGRRAGRRPGRDDLRGRGRRGASTCGCGCRRELRRDVRPGRRPARSTVPDDDRAPALVPLGRARDARAAPRSPSEISRRDLHARRSIVDANLDGLPLGTAGDAASRRRRRRSSWRPATDRAAAATPR
ncbi:MAG: hypothetical protein MZW92_22155 [Comamonadaceae bacterium]|nr:hypothetical protein [Comamonadaceae bacterium]